MAFLGFFLLCCIGFVSSEDISASFRCNFEDNDCGIVNVHGADLLWERKEMGLANRDGYVMALQSTTGEVQSGKLMSPRFEMNMSMPGCLTFELYMQGFVDLALQIENDIETSKFIIANDVTTSDQWNSYTTDVYVVNYITFYFEGRIDPYGGSEVIALDNIVFELNNC